jgi:hypothetical protein
VNKKIVTAALAIVVIGAVSVAAYLVLADEEKTCKGIVVSENPDKTSYSVGDPLDLSGMVVTATYSDGSTKTITDYLTTPADGSVFKVIGTQTVFVAYAEDGKTVLTMFDVVVK